MQIGKLTFHRDIHTRLIFRVGVHTIVPHSHCEPRQVEDIECGRDDEQEHCFKYIEVSLVAVQETLVVFEILDGAEFRADHNEKMITHSI